MARLTLVCFTKMDVKIKHKELKGRGLVWRNGGIPEHTWDTVQIL
jgi:hypothetical protein